jgi:hypothetical protein
VHPHIHPDKNRQEWIQRLGTEHLAHRDLVHTDFQELKVVLEELKMIKQYIKISIVEELLKVLKYITGNMSGNHLKLIVDSEITYIT